MLIHLDPPSLPLLNLLAELLSGGHLFVFVHFVQKRREIITEIVVSTQSLPTVRGHRALYFQAAIVQIPRIRMIRSQRRRRHIPLRSAWHCILIPIPSNLRVIDIEVGADTAIPVVAAQIEVDVMRLVVRSPWTRCRRSIGLNRRSR